MAASIAKTIVATGCSSGLGFEAVKQLLEQAQPYKFILGARDTTRLQSALDGLTYDTSKHSLSLLPLELGDLGNVRSFAQQTLAKLGPGKIDYLLLNAGSIRPASVAAANPAKWCEPYVVNHLSQHYLTHLLREKLVESKTRVVVVSSGAVRNVPDTSVLEKELLAGADTKDTVVYCDTKFIQLLGAHWWRRQLAGTNVVVAVSPGLIPGTGLGRHGSFKPTMDMPDAKPLATGAESILRAFARDDLPEDPDRIFLTSWGEWWATDVIAQSLDRDLQEKWSPSTEEIEAEAGL